MNVRGTLAALLVAGAPLLTIDATAAGGTGASVVYVRDTGRGPVLFSVTPQGEKHRIGPIGGDILDVSPNGRWVVYGGAFDRDIYKMRLDGTNPVRLTTDEFRGASPAWSHDGKKIVFQHSDQVDDGFTNLYVMNADGSNVKQLTKEPGCEVQPTWSPDGKSIAFTRVPTVIVGYGFFCGYNGGTDLYLMDPDGSNLRALTTTPEYLEMEPDWSPDSTKLAFECLGTEELRAKLCTTEIAAVSVEVLFEADEIADPAWSPSGKRLAFSLLPSTEEDIDAEIAIIRADGSGVRQLTDNHQDDGSPTWGPR